MRQFGKKWEGQSVIIARTQERNATVAAYPLLKEENERLRVELKETQEMLAICISVLRSTGHLSNLPVLVKPVH